MNAIDPFGKHSPFVEIPWALNAHERLTLEAIRYSVQMLLHSYERLRAAAEAYSVNGFDKTQRELPLRISILSDAWALIDMLNKLRDLIMHYPAVAFADARDVRVLIKQSEPVNYLRNQFQHLSGQMRRRVDLIAASDSVLGQVSWIFVPSPEDNTKPIFLFGVSGGGAAHDDSRQQSIKASPVGGSQVEVPVGRFELHAFNKKISFNQQLTNLKAGISSMEEQLRPILRARAEKAASARGIAAESLLKPMLESSAFRFDLGFQGQGGVSADQKVEVVTTMKQPPVTF